jgi:hypothetical protein
MSQRAPTVAQLKQLLEDRGLPTSGLKADLVARLEAARVAEAAEAAKTMVTTNPTLKGLPTGVQRLIREKMNAGVFYFSEQVANQKNIGDKESLLEGIFPTELEWDIGSGSVKRASAILSKDALQKKMVELLNTPGLKKVTMKRDHLTVQIELNAGGWMEAQILFTYPGSPTADYTLQMRTKYPYDPLQPDKKLPVVFAQFKRYYKSTWPNTQASLKDSLKALHDVLLGVHWIRKYITNQFSTFKGIKFDSQFIFENNSDPMRTFTGFDDKKTLVFTYLKKIKELLLLK